MQVCWNDWNLDLTITDSDEPWQPWWDHHMPIFSHRWDMVRSSQRLRARRARTEKTCRATTAQSVTSSEQRSSLDRARDCVLSEISKLCRWSCTSATQPFSNCSNLSIAIQLWIGWRSLWTVKFACHLDKRMSRSSSTLSQVCITKLYCKLGEN